MPGPEDKLPEELKPDSVKGWASVHGESVIQTRVVCNPEDSTFKVDESKCQMGTFLPPPPNPFETHGTIYSNGQCSDSDYGVKYDPVATVNEGRTRLIVNLETLRKNPRCLQLVIELLYASLRS